MYLSALRTRKALARVFWGTLWRVGSRRERRGEQPSEEGVTGHMEGTRDQIVRILQREGAASVDGLSRALGLASATIRRHLDILQRDQLVAFTQVRKATGRPEYSFSLTEAGHEALPKGYDVLLTELVEELGALDADEIGGKSGSELLNFALARIGARVAAEYGRGNGDVTRTLEMALEDRMKNPELERREDGLHIKVTNCPFRSVARLDGAVCMFGKSLISAIAGAEIRQEAGIAQGGDHCSYVVPLEAIDRPAA